VARLLALVDTSGATAVDVIVVDDSRSGIAELPHEELIKVLADALGPARVGALWAQATRYGAHWRRYGQHDCLGLVSDPQSSPLATADAATGEITLDSREALAATLHPQGDAATIERRTALAHDLLQGGGVARGTNTSESVTKVLAAVEDACSGKLPADDKQIVDLAVALGDCDVRDRCFTHIETPRARGAKDLWTCLTRQAPPGLRTNPACLVAVFAYATGDGALAQVALETALTDDPGNKLAVLFRQAVDGGIWPAKVVEMFRGAGE
jgi:uncharacterized protein DUF4192